MTANPSSPVFPAAAPALAGIDRAVLEELFDHTPDIAFFIKDAAGRYTTVNNSLVERHGLRSKAQMLGRRPCDVCVGSFGRTLVDRALAGGHVEAALFTPSLTLNRPIVAIGAPVGAYYDEVARRLATRSISPPHCPGR